MFSSGKQPPVFVYRVSWVVVAPERAAPMREVVAVATAGISAPRLRVGPLVDPERVAAAAANAGRAENVLVWMPGLRLPSTAYAAPAVASSGQVDRHGCLRIAGSTKASARVGQALAVVLAGKKRPAWGRAKYAGVGAGQPRLLTTTQVTRAHYHHNSGIRLLIWCGNLGFHHNSNGIHMPDNRDGRDTPRPSSPPPDWQRNHETSRREPPPPPKEEK